MVYNREQAARRAEASKHGTQGACQAWTRGIFGAPSAGDQDHDGDADAVDGWKSEPVHRRHGDRHPPRGVPVAWSGGSHGHGHRAVSLGNGMIRSIDVNGPGTVGTVPLAWFEAHWHLNYLGWSETMDGLNIPLPPKPKPLTRGSRVDTALKNLRGAKGKGTRAKKIKAAIASLVKVKPHR